MLRHAIFVVVLLLGGGPAAMMATEPRPTRDQELAREPSWTSPGAVEVRRRAVAWATEAAGPEGAAMVEPIWEQFAAAGAGADLIDAAMATAAAIDRRAAAVRAGGPDANAADLGRLDTESTSDFGRQAVKLWLGRELVRHDRFDEALPLLADLDVITSVDPAALLFHRGCCQHWLLNREAALESFDRLLEREDELPARFARLGRLLRADIATVREDSLDHIARRMRDVRRRLDLGYAGPETRRVQAGVIDSLDKLIEDLEKQQQQQQGQAGSSGSGSGGQGGGAARPMEDSKLARGLGKGDVKKRDIGTGDGWGDLPPHEREAALQQIGREFPPHYREAIEEYFKRLATGGEEGP
jgi:hypothetical protein